MTEAPPYEKDFVVDSNLLTATSQGANEKVDEPGSIRTKNILGGVDDRRRVQDTLIKPFRWVCQILAVSPQVSAKGVGTGFVIGPQTILTAAHNLKVKNHPAQHFEVYPAVNGDRQAPPLGKYTATFALPHPRYAHPDGSRRYDLAVIYLNQPLPANLLPPPLQFASLPLATITPQSISGQKGFVTGYPKNYPAHAAAGMPKPDIGVQAFQYYCVSRLNYSSEIGLLTYDLDTEGGQSGSPLIAVHRDPHTGRDQSVAVGIHIEGGTDRTGNFAVPLDADRMGFVTSHLQPGGGTSLA